MGQRTTSFRSCLVASPQKNTPTAALRPKRVWENPACGFLPDPLSSMRPSFRRPVPCSSLKGSLPCVPAAAAERERRERDRERERKRERERERETEREQERAREIEIQIDR